MTSIILSVIGLLFAAAASVLVLTNAPDVSAIEAQANAVASIQQPNVEDLNRLLQQP